jgi:hypothetical protein
MKEENKVMVIDRANLVNQLTPLTNDTKEKFMDKDKRIDKEFMDKDG